ncbi:fumarylacetoacetate hydrolase family protein [Mycolicibacterium fortuitum]
MRIAVQSGRAVLVDGDRCLDIETTSESEFSSDVYDIYKNWTDFSTWAKSASFVDAKPLDHAALGAVSPNPRQVFGVGLNFRKHVEEAGWPMPEVPLVFTKFPSSVVGPGAVIELTGPSVDWEVELVVVIGEKAHRVSQADAWSHVAGLTIGQDLSDRDTQMRPKDNPQFSLGKSHPGFSPIGPVLVTPDELPDRDAIRMGCAINGVTEQNGCSDDMIFSVAFLIEYLSDMLPLLPGDLIFTGTPSGIGSTRTPPVFLQPTDIMTSWIEGIGEMTHTFTSGPGVRV